MKVYKFGGASVKNSDAVKNVYQIASTANELGVVVVSAMGKTTDALEKLAKFAEKFEEEKAQQQLQKIIDFHAEIISGLFENENIELKNELEELYQQLQRTVQGIIYLGVYPHMIYDKIVAFGELISTKIISAYFQSQGLQNLWVDAREIIKTDSSFKNAKVIWSETTENIQSEINPIINSGKLIVTQGFIASNLEGQTTTLGREGSDYTAAIFANCLDAESVSVWKDVPGIMSADPKKYENAQKIDDLSYERAIQMTYFGAKVIHPKTIQPLVQKDIPLLVKSFVDISSTGTIIQNEVQKSGVENFLELKDLILVRLKPRNLQFVNISHLHRLLSAVERNNLKVIHLNTQALTINVVFQNSKQAILEMKSMLAQIFIVELFDEFTLRTTLGKTEKMMEISISESVMEVDL